MMQWLQQQQGRKWLGRLIVLTITLIGGLSWRHDPALAVTARHYTELQFPPAPAITVPDYERFQLSNGLQVYLLEDHELPLVSGAVLLKTGDRLEPADKTGLASIVGTVLRSGGSQLHPADVLNRLLEDRAAAVETGIDTAYGSASFSALSEDLTEVFQLFTEVLRQPALPQDKIDLAKNQWRGSIARRNDDPNSIVGREFQKLIYGADSPYARTVEYATLDRITRRDVLEFYRTSIRPDAIQLGIIGDFEPQAMRSLIERTLGDWQPAAPPLVTPLPVVAQSQQGGVFLVNQPQLTQSFVQIGHLGARFDDPDYAPLSVMNEVLNGLGGRLVNEVRSRQGLAYTVYAYWSPRFDYPGTFVGGGQTRSPATVPFITATRAELERIRTAPVTPAELNRAKDSVLNGFIFNFATPAQTLSRVMRYDYYGYPQDFIFRYQKQVAATTAADVQRVARAHLQPDRIVTLVVGNARSIDPPLSALQPNAQVTQLDVTIPQPQG